MASGIVGGVVRDLGRLFAQGSGTGLSEGQLLERAVDRADEACLRSLVERHGPMVLGVCRQLLRDPNDVDDAFQATFLVLVRRAHSLHRRDQLGGWLYGVAVRVAKRARITAARRLPHERTLQEEAIIDEVSAEPSKELESSEIRQALHDEIARLPESYRQALVLCYLEGQSHDEAAQSLGWPVGTVKGRLARARDLLRDRLARRGFAPAGASTLLMAGPSKASVPASLVASTTTSALGLTARAIVAAGAGVTASGPAVTLMEGALHTMSLTQIKFFGSAITAFGLFAAGSAVISYGDQDPGGPGAGSSIAVAARSPRNQAAGTASSPASPAAASSNGSQATAGTKPAGVPGAGPQAKSVNTTKSTSPASLSAPATEKGRGASATATTASAPAPAGSGFAAPASVTKPASGMSGMPGMMMGMGGPPAATASRAATSEEVKLAREALAELDALRRQARVSAGDAAFVKWARRLLDAELAENPGREQKIVATKNYLKSAERFAEISKIQFERGQQSRLEQREAEFLVLEARRMVAEASAIGASTKPAALAPAGTPGEMGMAPAGMPGGMGMMGSPASGMTMGPAGTAPALTVGSGSGGDARNMQPATSPVSAGRAMPTAVVQGGFGGSGFGAGGFGGGGAVTTSRSRLASPVPNPADEPRNAAILKKLESSVDLKFESMPLAEVVKYLKGVSVDKDGKALPIYVDPIALEESGASMESAVTIDLEDIPLRTALRLILSQLNLEYEVADGVLLIVSPRGQKEN